MILDRGAQSTPGDTTLVTETGSKDCRNTQKIEKSILQKSMLNNGAIIHSLKKNDEYVLRPHIAWLFLYLFINLLNNILCIKKM